MLPREGLMDNRIRSNEICVIDLPRCDFVFSSTRSCFIAYGFKESTLEMTILRNLLRDRGIDAYEAGGDLSPGQFAFCAKICSKIIISQFCIVLLNNERKNDIQIPNANVNMEYGLMIGFNKYIVPFQREDHELPFNVAGLDTIKYTTGNFEMLAAKALDKAIRETQQSVSTSVDIDLILSAYLLSHDAVVNSLQSSEDKSLYDLGKACGFNLLNDFSGLKYIYFGNFSAFRPEIIVWRLKKLQQLLQRRFEAVPKRLSLKIMSDEQKRELELATNQLFNDMEIWILVPSEDDRQIINNNLCDNRLNPSKIFTVGEVQTSLEDIVESRK